MLFGGFGLKILFFMKYSVSFIQGGNEVLLADGLNDIQACSYAINLHQSSNVPHEIKVRHQNDADSPCLLLLER